MTREQKMMAWHYSKVRKEAVDVLAEILGEEVSDTKAGVCNALALIMHRKGAKETSRALLAASSWIWGAHEASALEAETFYFRPENLDALVAEVRKSEPPPAA